MKCKSDYNKTQLNKTPLLLILPSLCNALKGGTLSMSESVNRCARSYRLMVGISIVTVCSENRYFRKSTGRSALTICRLKVFGGILCHFDWLSVS